MVVVLDNIRSMQNVGTIFRAADAIGVRKIYLCGITPAPLDEFGRKRSQMTKISLGAEDTIKWEKHKQTFRLLDELKRNSYKIFVVEQDKNSIPYFKAELPKDKKVALVLGHELKGVTKAGIKRADKILEIPMKGKKDSLNVAIAFAIVGYHLSSPLINN